jgi:PST family polysaccharide transporter
LSDGWVPTEHGRGTGALQQRVARGLTWTLLDTWGTQLLGLLVFVILARLLDQVAFGLVALAAVFVAFAQLFVDQGLGDALIQRRSVSRSQIDTAFWVAVLTGGVLTIAGIALGPLIATLVGEPAIGPILQVLSLTFLLTAFSSIQLALLRREMRFKSLAIRKLLAVGGSGVIGVAMALNGFGAWSLVGQQLSNAVISVVMLWTVSPWRPGLKVARADFRQLFGFGLNVVGSDLLNFLSGNVDRLLVGTYLGPGALGYYAVAHRVLDTSQSLLVSFARKLAFPIFSRLQDDRDRLRRAYSRVQRALSMIILPGYVGLALVAQEAIVVIFGDRWGPSGPVAAVLFLLGPALAIQIFTGALLNSVGHPEVTFRIRLITTVTNVVGFFAAVVIFRDIVFVAAAYVLRAYLLLPLILYWVSKYAGIRVLDQLTQLRGAAIATAVMSAAVIGVKLVLTGLGAGNALLLLTEVVIGITVFAITLLVVDRELLRDVATLGAQAVPGGRPIAARLGLALPEQLDGRPGKGRAKGRRKAADSAAQAAAGAAAMGLSATTAPDDAAAAAETATEGASVGAELLADGAASPIDETLGDV